jgi:polar amino acid transport system permease protein
MTSGLWTNWLAPGIWVTVQLTIYAALLAAVIAFTIGIARTSRWWWLRIASGLYVEIFRGMSALVLMFWLVFVVPLAFHLQLLPTWAAVLALGLSFGAYGSEVVRGALTAVPVGQREAATALGFTPAQELWRVLLPQALPEMMPPFTNLMIELLKGTALVSAVSVADISFAAQLCRLATGKSLEVYVIVLAIYFVLAFAITRVMRVLERRLRAGIGQQLATTERRR